MNYGRPRARSSRGSSQSVRSVPLPTYLTLIAGGRQIPVVLWTPPTTTAIHSRTAHAIKCHECHHDLCLSPSLRLPENADERAKNNGADCCQHQESKSNVDPVGQLSDPVAVP